MQPAELVALLKLVSGQTINNNTAKEVLADMFVSGKTAQAIVEEKGLAQISDESAIADLVAKVIEDNPENVQRYKDGATKLRGFFVGQVMKASKGKANPALVNRLLDELLTPKLLS